MKKVGFDIHGVIDKNQELFSNIINDLRELKYEIHILTGSLIDDNLLKKLESYNIKYDHIFSILNYHREIGTEMWKDHRGWWIDDEEWNKTKSNYCYRNGLNFHIDDTRVYGKYFKTPFGHITPLIDNPRILEIKGDVNFEILEIFKKYEGYYKMKFI